MAKMRIPLLFIPLSSAKMFGTRFKGLGNRFVAFYPPVRYDLKDLDINLPVDQYGAAAFFSAAIWAFLLSLFALLFLSTIDINIGLRLLLIFLISIVMFAGFSLFYLFYPGMMLKNMGAMIDRELIFVIRDMIIQMSSGIPFFTVLENVGNSNYQYLSEEIRNVLISVKSGTPLINALENMALHTQSKFLKKISWQLVTSIRAGADLTSTLKGISKMLVDYQFSMSKAFNSELNFIILIYMMVSAVLPTIGMTVMVIFSVFGLLGITPDFLMLVVFASFFGQLLIIAYVQVKRPNLYM